MDVVDAIMPIGTQTCQERKTLPLHDVLSLQTNLALLFHRRRQGVQDHRASAREGAAALVALVVNIGTRQEGVLNITRLKFKDEVLAHVNITCNAIARSPFILFGGVIEAHIGEGALILVIGVRLEVRGTRACLDPVIEFAIQTEGAAKGHVLHAVVGIGVGVIPTRVERFAIGRANALVGRLVTILIEEIRPRGQTVKQTEGEARCRREHRAVTRCRGRPTGFAPFVSHRHTHGRRLVFIHAVDVRHPLQTRARGLRIGATNHKVVKIFGKACLFRREQHRSPTATHIGERTIGGLTAIRATHRALHDIYTFQ